MLLTALARRLEPELAPFLAAAITLTVSTLLVVAAFATQFAERIQERNTFFVAPFFLIALLVWVDRGLPRPRWPTIAVVASCALLPLMLPFERFISAAAISDTLALLPIWDAYGSLPFDSIDATVLIGAGLAAALFLLVPQRWALALPAVTLLFLTGVSYNVWRGEYGFATARVSAGALFNGIRVGHRDWIDRGLPAGATAAFVWTGVTDRFAVNQNEFFNRAVGPVYFVGGPTPGNLAETEVRIDEQTGEIRTTDGTRRSGALRAHRGRDHPRRRRRRPRSGNRTHALARHRPTRSDDDEDRGPISERHLVGPRGRLDARALLAAERSPSGSRATRTSTTRTRS